MTPSPVLVARTEGVMVAAGMVRAVVGAQLIVGVALETSNVTSLVPSRYSDVAAAVARTTQLPVPV